MAEQPCYLLSNDNYADHKIDNFKSIMEKGKVEDKCTAMEKVNIFSLFQPIFHCSFDLL